MKYACNEYANFIQSYVVHFDINEWLNFSEMVAGIGMEGIRCQTSASITLTQEITWSRIYVANFKPNARKNKATSHTTPTQDNKRFVFYSNDMLNMSFYLECQFRCLSVISLFEAMTSQ